MSLSDALCVRWVLEQRRASMQITRGAQACCSNTLWAVFPACGYAACSYGLVLLGGPGNEAPNSMCCVRAQVVCADAAGLTLATGKRNLTAAVGCARKRIRCYRPAIGKGSLTAAAGALESARVLYARQTMKYWRWLASPPRPVNQAGSSLLAELRTERGRPCRYVDYLLEALRRRELFQWLILSPDAFLHTLLFRDRYNFMAVTARLPERLLETMSQHPGALTQARPNPNPNPHVTQW